MTNDELRMLQLEELNIFKKIVEICDKYNLQYYVLGGTLLGAVRHKGFIPWDDDLDIGFKREDYEKFMQVAPNEFKAPYELSCYKNDKTFIYPYARVVNSNILLCREYTKNKTIQPLWVDVFPLDGAPKDGLKRFIWEKKITYYRGIRNVSCFDELVDITKKYHGIKKIVVSTALNIKIEKLFHTQKILTKLDNYLKRNTLEKNACIANPMGGWWFKEVYPKSYYDESVQLDFEGMKVNCPSKYKEILEQMYGDYMTPPPEKDRNKHGTSIYKIKEKQ